MIMTKLRFIDSSRNEKERNEDIVKTTVTKMMIFELKELLVNAETFLTLTNETVRDLSRASQIEVSIN